MRPVVAQSHKCVTINATGCKFDSHSGKLNITLFYFYALVPRQSVEFNSVTQYAMPLKFSEKHMSALMGTDVLTLGSKVSSNMCGIQRDGSFRL